MAAVDSPRYRSLLLDTLQWLENGDWAKHRRRQGGPIERFAAKVLARRTKKAKKKAGKLRKLDPRQRHKLGIAVKKLPAYFGDDDPMVAKKACDSYRKDAKAVTGDVLVFRGAAMARERAAGIPLKIAANVDKVDEDYFRNDILPLIDGPGVEFIGEINEREKTQFLGEAAALLFPVDWPEPFGLVMIEAMACGTPVLAFRCGSVPEVIDYGVTGKAVGSEEEAVAALPAILAYNRRAVRQGFEERFTATRMAQDYISTYRRLMKTRTSGARPRQFGLNGGNGLAPNPTEKPFVALFEAGADPEIPT
jgi:hypothetical protein